MIDPLFQQRHFFTIYDDTGQAVGSVYVLDREHLPHHASHRKEKERVQPSHITRRRSKRKSHVRR